MEAKLKTKHKITIGVPAALCVLFTSAVPLFWNKLRTLASLEKLHEGGMYRMTRRGDYSFYEFFGTWPQATRSKLRACLYKL